MTLHVESQGSGEPLVMLHGWGMHGGMWGEVVSALVQNFEVHCVDLPGHGFSREGGREQGDAHPAPSTRPSPFALPAAPFSLDSIVSELSTRFQGPLNLLGWSLGGMIAQRWAVREPKKVRRLVLVASTPCFSARADWAHGMAPETLRQFACELEQNFAATLRRFLALQVRGSDGERELLAALRERLFSRGEPDVEALRGGLAILREADLRADLARIPQPTLVIAGQRDKLTPAQASHYLAQTMTDARVVEIEGAAHAPFLSHPQFFIEQLKSFVHE